MRISKNNIHIHFKESIFQTSTSPYEEVCFILNIGKSKKDIYLSYYEIGSLGMACSICNKINPTIGLDVTTEQDDTEVEIESKYYFISLSTKTNEMVVLPKDRRDDKFKFSINYQHLYNILNTANNVVNSLVEIKQKSKDTTDKLCKN